MAEKSLQDIKSTTAKALLEKEFKPRKMVIDPWLRTEETAVIWAASGVGKTMLSLSIALAVAGGGTLADWSCPTPRKVVYIDGEMNQQDIRDRIKLLIDTGAVSLKHPETALENLVLVARQAQDVGSHFYDITSEVGQEALIQLVRLHRAELLILDNFTTLTDDLDDENDATQFKQVQGFFLQMKRMGIATILVHHANKGGKQMRGSTALATTFEVIIGLTRPILNKTGEARFEVTFEKFRGLSDARLDRKEWVLGSAGWTVRLAEPEDVSLDPIFAALRSYQFTSQSEIAERVGVNRSTVSGRIKLLECQGHLKTGEAEKMFTNAKELRDMEEIGDKMEAF